MSAATPLTELEAGIELPSAVRFTTTAQLVRYAGAARDFSGIHYDLGYARERGFPDVIVHGFLKAAFLSELACEWGGAGSWLRSFAVRYEGIDVVGAPIVCRGRVSGVQAEERRVALELWTERPDGTRTTRATGVLQFDESTDIQTMPTTDHERGDR
jgi:acyl dehydratase